MSAWTASGAAYTAAVSYANGLATSAGGTVTSNVNFWLLLAIGSIIVGIVFFLLHSLKHFGRRH